MFADMIGKRVRISVSEFEGPTLGMLPKLTVGTLRAVEGTVLHLTECENFCGGEGFPDTSYNTASLHFNWAQLEPNR